ncbi:TPA: hypothetical protein N0F65_011197, partial [Lagenidium giganteum]
TIGGNHWHTHHDWLTFQVGRTIPRAKKRAASATETLPDTATDIANALKGKRTNASTKRTYQSKINVMVRWLQTHHPSLISDDKSLRLPLTFDAVIGFFGHLCAAAHHYDLDDGIWGYQSALVDAYKTRVLSLDPHSDTELRRVLEGYEKVINR